MTVASTSLRRLATALILLALWEFVGRFQLIAQGALPAPSAILLRFIADFGDYPAHLGATATAALIGFIIGNAIAIMAGIVFILSPLAERLSRWFNVALFALPPIAIVPILILMLDGMTPRIVLAALGCYFTSMTATLVGLRLADARSLDLVRAYGGGALSQLRFVRVRQAAPAILAGLQISAPNAVLGAILAEFGGGGRQGLGVYLIGSLGRADPARLWGIGLAATAMAGLAFLVTGLLAARLAGSSRAVTLTPQQPVAGREASGLTGWILAGAALLVPFALWWLLIIVSGAPAIIAKTPADVLAALANPVVLERLGAALIQTLPLCFLGMLAGLAFAFLLAMTSEIAPRLKRLMLPVALVTQSMPLVALTPLLVLIFGRGAGVTLAITISVTFFPAFVLLVEGLRSTPPAALDLVRAYGGGRRQRMGFVQLPFAMPYLFAAARLALPRALLGVMIAEWLATGRGLGNLLNQSRGQLDYTMIWTVALASVVVSILLYQAIGPIERAAARRFGGKDR